MGKDSGDYLDRFSDKDYKGPGSLGDVFVRSHFPAAGLGMSAADSGEARSLTDTDGVDVKRSAIRNANAIALCTGLFWVEMRKNKRLDPGAIYAAEGARKLLEDPRSPSSQKVQVDMSTDAIVSDKSRPDNVFRVTNARTLEDEIKSRLQPIGVKSVKPETLNKHIVAYTEYSHAVCLVKGSLILVSLDDLLELAGRKYKILFRFVKGDGSYTTEMLGGLKETFNYRHDSEKYANI